MAERTAYCRREHRRWFVPFLVCGLIAGCAGGDDVSVDRTTLTTTANAAPSTTPGDDLGDVIYPAQDWESIGPQTAGFDPVALDRIAAKAEAGGSNCLLVVRDGKRVAEWYWNGTEPSTTQEVFSATKSYTSTLVGIAESEGELDILDHAAEYIPDWEGTPSEAVTIENLLKNDSGRHWDFQTDYVKMVTQARDKTAFAIGLTQDAPPGTTWAYNNSAIQTIEAVLENATGEDVAAYAERKLLDPIGMTSSKMTKDASGGTLTFMGLSSTCRDMARFGYLMLRQGQWGEREIVPADFVRAATGRSGTKLNAAYGYLFWLNRKGHVASAAGVTTAEDGKGEPGTQLVPGAPHDMFWAIGLGNQIISIDPGSETVVVRLGSFNAPAGAEQFTTKDAAAVVTDALVD